MRTFLDGLVVLNQSNWIIRSERQAAKVDHLKEVLTALHAHVFSELVNTLMPAHDNVLQNKVSNAIYSWCRNKIDFVAMVHTAEIFQRSITMSRDNNNAITLVFDRTQLDSLPWDMIVQQMIEGGTLDCPACEGGGWEGYGTGSGDPHFRECPRCHNVHRSPSP